MLIRKLNINLVTLHSNGLANLMIGSLMNMSFTNQELDELRSNKNGQGGCKTPEKVTNG